MALPPELEALIAAADAKDREGLRKILTENHENGLRQADYSKKMNELSEKTKKWQDWHKEADAEFRAAKEEATNLKQRIAELEKAKANAGNPDDDDDLGLTGVEDEALARELRKSQTALRSALDRQAALEEKLTAIDSQIAEGKLITAERFEEEVTKRGDNLGNAIFGIMDIQTKAKEEFGQSLERQKVIEEVQRLGGDFDQAYKNLTEEMKLDKMRKDIEAEYEQKYNERLANSNLPTDQGNANGEPSNLGPLQTRLAMLNRKEGEGESSIPDDIPAGDPRLAKLMGAELRSEGKF
jgi:hypothetical protein